jgi:hypothetical protein
MSMHHHGADGSCHPGPGGMFRCEHCARDLEDAAVAAGEIAADLLFRTFQEFIDENKTTLAERTEDFTVDGCAYYRVTPGQREVLMTMAPEAYRRMNEQEKRYPDEE